MVELLKNYGPFLLFGLVMILMMRRGGCCGNHGNHGEHKDHDTNKDLNPKRGCH